MWIRWPSCRLDFWSLCELAIAKGIRDGGDRMTCAWIMGLAHILHMSGKWRKAHRIFCEHWLHASARIHKNKYCDWLSSPSPGGKKKKERASLLPWIYNWHVKCSHKCLDLGNVSRKWLCHTACPFLAVVQGVGVLYWLHKEQPWKPGSDMEILDCCFMAHSLHLSWLYFII